MTQGEDIPRGSGWPGSSCPGCWPRGSPHSWRARRSCSSTSDRCNPTGRCSRCSVRHSRRRRSRSPIQRRSSARSGLRFSRSSRGRCGSPRGSRSSSSSSRFGPERGPSRSAAFTGRSAEPWPHPVASRCAPQGDMSARLRGLPCPCSSWRVVAFMRRARILRTSNARCSRSETARRSRSNQVNRSSCSMEARARSGMSRHGRCSRGSTRAAVSSMRSSSRTPTSTT